MSYQGKLLAAEYIDEVIDPNTIKLSFLKPGESVPSATVTDIRTLSTGQRAEVEAVLPIKTT